MVVYLRIVKKRVAFSGFAKVQGKQSKRNIKQCKIYGISAGTVSGINL
jgi:hypothetical protein